MENNSMETRKPRIARKHFLLIAILAISLVVGAAPTAATVSGFSDLHSHKHAQLHFRAHLDFGVLSSASTGKTFANALVVERGRTSPIRFAFVNGATTWDRVFSGISIVVQTQGGENSGGNNDHKSGTHNSSGSNTGDEAPVQVDRNGSGNDDQRSATENIGGSDSDDEALAGVACMSIGTGTCPTGLTAAFTPKPSTSYDYVATFTTVSNIPSGITLQTMCSSS